MRDYIATLDDGSHVPVAKLPTIEIQAMLQDGIESCRGDPVGAITDRLNLELFIRSLGLR